MNLPAQLLLGIYLGALTGVFPALAAWGLGFTFRYFSGVTIPGTVVMVFAVALAGVQGGLLGLLDASAVSDPTKQTAYVVALLVVMMAALYSHKRGDEMGATFPRRLTLKRLRDRTLPADVIEHVGRFGRVRIRVVGEVGDVEGYPPLPAALRAEIREGEWTFPADLPVSALETRLADRLTAAHDLAEVVATIDAEGQATISAAPAPGSLSRRVPEGERAVSVDALLPTGLARGDEVTLSADGGVVAGTVLGAGSGEGESTPTAKPAGSDGEGGKDAENADGDEVEERAVESPTNPTTAGGEGRVTVAASHDGARTLLGTESAGLVVEAKGTRRELELVSLLRRAGKRFARVSIRADGDLDGTTLGEARIRDTHDVVVLAVKRSGTWRFAPRGDTTLDEGDELFAVGTRSALAAFEGAVA